MHDNITRTRSHKCNVKNAWRRKVQDWHFRDSPLTKVRESGRRFQGKKFVEHCCNSMTKNIKSSDGKQKCPLGMSSWNINKDMDKIINLKLILKNIYQIINYKIFKNIL